ncbi:DUF4405 domain-containing protein [Methanosarcina sp. KYL-1]|uniref:DUF4405 domain-containing protein n=1 Tax=Methanosarcina sp. KYL-1 TaxID=2602068 RepID=UPI00210137E2|nr:DUF4405 domain-containing protein [Methanosarcina sp. KYL-1]MCQ1534933.1 DUF4405 domain-containing protein [Methanosarcina sp. KYL-1]
MKRITLNYLVDLSLFVQFVLVGYSGLLLFFNDHGTGPFWKMIHEKLGIVMLVFFIIHMALHSKWITCTTKNLFRRENGRKEVDVRGISCTGSSD